MVAHALPPIMVKLAHAHVPQVLVVNFVRLEIVATRARARTEVHASMTMVTAYVYAWVVLTVCIVTRAIAVTM